MEKVDGLGWVVGFYCGEGSLSAHTITINGRKYVSLHLSISQNSFCGEISDTLIRVRDILQCGNINREKNRPVDKFVISKIMDIQRVIHMMWPGLSLSKKIQVERAYRLYNKGQAEVVSRPGTRGRKASSIKHNFTLEVPRT